MPIRLRPLPTDGTAPARPAHPSADVGQGRPLEGVGDVVADLLEDAEELLLLLDRRRLVKVLAGGLRGGERPLEEPDDLGQGDLVRGARQAIAAVLPLE